MQQVPQLHRHVSHLQRQRVRLGQLRRDGLSCNAAAGLSCRQLQLYCIVLREADRLMQSKGKFSTQYSTTPGFKKQTCNFLQAMSTRQITWRPPGARFFLLQRRKNRGRKTPPKAGAVPRPWISPLFTASILQPHTVPATRQICACIRPLMAGEQTACRFAVAYGVRR